MCFFKVKHYFGHISGMVGPIDVKWKGSASIGYWVHYMTLTFDLTYDLDLGCFKVKFRNSSISEIVGLIDVKWKKWLNMILGQLYDLAFDHTDDLDLGVEISRSKSETALSQEWSGWLIWNEKDVRHPIMIMILTSVTMGGLADVPDSDGGDFRRRRAVAISSFLSSKCLLQYHMQNVSYFAQALVDVWCLNSQMLGGFQIHLWYIQFIYMYTWISWYRVLRNWYMYFCCLLFVYIWATDVK